MLSLSRSITARGGGRPRPKSRLVTPTSARKAYPTLLEHATGLNLQAHGMVDHRKQHVSAHAVEDVVNSCLHQPWVLRGHLKSTYLGPLLARGCCLHGAQLAALWPPYRRQNRSAEAATDLLWHRSAPTDYRSLNGLEGTEIHLLKAQTLPLLQFWLIRVFTGLTT